MVELIGLPSLLTDRLLAEEGVRLLVMLLLLILLLRWWRLMGELDLELKSLDMRLPLLLLSLLLLFLLLLEGEEGLLCGCKVASETDTF